MTSLFQYGFRISKGTPREIAPNQGVMRIDVHLKEEKPTHRAFWQFRILTFRPKPHNFVKVGVTCKPQTNTSYVFLGQHACRLDLSHPTCISSKFVRMRLKKRCEFQTSETQSKWFPFLARTCAREMCSHRPVLSTEIEELSCLGNIVSRGF